MKQVSRSRPKSGDIELDLGRYELRRDGRRIKLEKKPMELLFFLVRRREQLVSREEIQAKLWHTDLFIDTERNINNIVRKIRRALGDNSAKQRFLETVVGKGYRFVGPIRTISPLYSNSDPAESADDKMPFRGDAAWGGDRPSLAVLPLLFFGDLDDDNGLSLGFADSLVSQLANLEGVDVLPTSAILNVPSNAKASEIASRLGVRFVVHGAIQSSKAESRLSVELFDSHLQSRCFIRKFVLDVNRPFEQVDDIARHTAKALKRPLRNPPPQSRARFSRDALAYGEFIQGYRDSYTGDRKLLEEAARHLMNAVARDPLFALAHAILSFVCTKASLRDRSQPELAGEGRISLPTCFGIGCGSARRTRGQGVSPLGTLEELPTYRSDFRIEACALSSEESPSCLQPSRDDPGAYRSARSLSCDV